MYTRPFASPSPRTKAQNPPAGVGVATQPPHLAPTNPSKRRGIVWGRKKRKELKMVTELNGVTLRAQEQRDTAPEQLVVVQEATPVDAVMKDAALESQIMEVPKKSGGVSENDNDQMNDLLQPILKIRDTILHKEHILQDQSAECDMDIQNILTEGKMTPKVVAIMEKYKETGSNMMEVANPSCCGDGIKTTSNKRKRLKEALQRNKCQELNEICCDIKCIPPRYTVLPSLEDGTFHAIVHFTCPGYDMSITGDPHQTPDGARCSAAANLIMELRKKAVEEEQHEGDAKIPS